MKRTCQACGAPFYDLRKKNIVCPKCDAPFDPAPPAKPKRPVPVGISAPKADEVVEKGREETKPLAKEKKPLAKEKKDADGDGAKTAAGKDDKDVSLKDEDEDDTEAGDDDDKDLIEDTSDLGRDDDDMSEVKEHIDDGVEDKN